MSNLTGFTREWATAMTSLAFFPLSGARSRFSATSSVDGPFDTFDNCLGGFCSSRREFMARLFARLATFALLSPGYTFYITM
jgi:hypothetical protein